MKCAVSAQGIRYAVRRQGSKVACCALTIGCGTVNEEDGGYSSGLAHFVEHTLFKGTPTKSAKVISSYLDRLGGELNAFTSKEDITIHSTTLKEDVFKAAGLLCEIATRACFPEDEIEKEKGVVIDEIESYKDSPSEDIYDTFEEYLFRGDPLSRPILGTVESVEGITRSEIVRFHKEFFKASNITFSIVSPLDEDFVEKKLLAIFAKFFTEIAPEASIIAPPLPEAKVFKGFKPFNTREDKDNNLVSCIMGVFAPTLYEEKDRIATALLCNILGGPSSNSRLNDRLREKNGWVYNVECTYTQYAHSGIIAISLGCEQKNLGRCIDAVKAECEKLQKIPLSLTMLRSAKKQILAQMAVSSENAENQALSLSKSLLVYGTVESDESIRAKVDAISSAKLQALARRLLTNFSTLIYV